MRLSRSKWENFIRCPFCFYLKEKHNIDPPRTPGHPINSRVDSLLKAEFDELRKNQQPHSIFKKYNFYKFKIDYRNYVSIFLHLNLHCARSAQKILGFLEGVFKPLTKI